MEGLILYKGGKLKELNGNEVNPSIDQLYSDNELFLDVNTTIAVIGSRKVSEYGKRVCRDIVSCLKGSGLTIVSGFMYGVDIEAHNAAISVGLRTIGVLGYGHSHINRYGYARSLHEKFKKTGLGTTISEYDPEFPPSKWTFPRRNRIIAAIAKCTLVIEADHTSGSIITANYALEQNKEVFAVPGSVYNKNSNGTNWLIKQGAQVATCAGDILEYIGIGSSQTEIRDNLDVLSKKIINKIEELDSLAHLSYLAACLEINTAELMVKLSELELAGYTKKDLSGRLFVVK